MIFVNCLLTERERDYSQTQYKWLSVFNENNLVPVLAFGTSRDGFHENCTKLRCHDVSLLGT